KGFLEVNQELCRILGYSREELLQKTWAETTHPEDLAAGVASFDRVIRGEIDGYSMEKRLIRKSGEIIHTIVSASSVRRADGPVDCVVGLIQGTTERKGAEEELRRTAADLAEAQRISHTGSWSWNPSTGQSVWSEEMFRIFGFPPEPTPPSAPARPTHPDDTARVKEAIDRAVSEESSFELDYRIQFSDGTIKHLHVVGRPIRNQAGLEYSGVLMDVTERKRAEVAVEKAQGQLARVTLMSAMGEVAAAIAHEVNQPLGAIVNNASICLRLLESTHPAAREAV